MQLLIQQKALGRTPAGRDIRPEALAALDAQSKKFMECLGCGMVGADVAFAAGCPNCNAKDVRVFRQ